MAFNRNRKLQENPATRQWVWKTTVLLQEALKDFVVGRFGAGALPGLGEAELRDFAFRSHSRAYTRAGLAEVVVVAPEMLPVIASIPAAELDPASPAFHETIEQAIATVLLVAPEVAAEAAEAALPRSHQGLLAGARAAALGLRRARAGPRRRLLALRDDLRDGRLDSVPVLSRIAARLGPLSSGNSTLARAARDVVEAAEARRRRIALFYEELLGVNPALRPFFDREAPGWSGSSDPTATTGS